MLRCANELVRHHYLWPIGRHRFYRGRSRRHGLGVSVNTAQFRGTFASQYAQACQPWKKGGGFRLMDFYTVVQDVTPGHVPAIPGPDEFCVFGLHAWILTRCMAW
jgi:hypothetical protein